jgi:UBX domain-containing protein 1
MADRDALISSFSELTGATAEQVTIAAQPSHPPISKLTIRSQATEYLGASNWDIQSAATSYYADMDEGEQAPASAAPAAVPEPEYTGPRTLDGRPAPEYAAASSSSTAKKPQKRTGLATLSSLGGGHGHDDSEDDDDYDDDEEDERRGPRDLFAGGEKSGLAVQDPAQRSSDPRKLINDIVAKARTYALH